MTYVGQTKESQHLQIVHWPSNRQGTTPLRRSLNFAKPPCARRLVIIPCGKQTAYQLGKSWVYWNWPNDGWVYEWIHWKLRNCFRYHSCLGVAFTEVLPAKWHQMTGVLMDVGEFVGHWPHWTNERHIFLIPQALKGHIHLPGFVLKFPLNSFSSVKLASILEIFAEPGFDRLARQIRDWAQQRGVCIVPWWESQWLLGEHKWLSIEQLVGRNYVFDRKTGQLQSVAFFYLSN